LWNQAWNGANEERKREREREREKLNSMDERGCGQEEKCRHRGRRVRRRRSESNSKQWTRNKNNWCKPASTPSVTKEEYGLTEGTWNAKTFGCPTVCIRKIVYKLTQRRKTKQKLSQKVKYESKFAVHLSLTYNFRKNWFVKMKRADANDGVDRGPLTCERRTVQGQSKQIWTKNLHLNCDLIDASLRKKEDEGRNERRGMRQK
jgi:hypothetical protein